MNYIPMKLYLVTVNKTNNSTIYQDKVIDIPHHDNLSDNVDEFINQLKPLIHETQSIVLHRNDVKRFVDSIPNSDKSLLDKIRRKLRIEFDVLRIRFNPRTMAYQDKAYIIHQRQY